MGADITQKQYDNDLEFNIIKGTNNVRMHRRKRKYYESHPGLIIAVKTPKPGEPKDLNLSHYHGRIVIPQLVPHKGKTYTVTELDEQLMFQGIKVYEITIPGTVHTVPHAAFANCHIEKVTMKEGIKEIAAEAFAGTWALTRVEVPDSVERINPEAFKFCPVLGSVTLGKGLRKIDESAFAKTQHIVAVTCKAITPPIVMDTNAFDDLVYQNAELCVPRESIERYRQHSYWGKFRKIVAIE